MDEQFGLALFVDRHDPLGDCLDGGVARTDFDRHRVDQQRGGQRADLVRKSGREQQRLAARGKRGEHGVQLARKAEVEHPVRFVQHQRLQLIELDRVLAVQVEQAAGRGHQQIESLAQFHHLRIDADAAVSDVGAQRQAGAIRCKALVHLFGQLPGWHQHQRAHRVGADLLGLHGEVLQDRQREASGLASAGLGRGQKIAPGEDGGDGLRLHRGRRLITERVERAHERIDQAEGDKRHGKHLAMEEDGRQFTLSRADQCRQLPQPVMRADFQAATTTAGCATVGLIGSCFCLQATSSRQGMARARTVQRTVRGFMAGSWRVDNSAAVAGVSIRAPPRRWRAGPPALEPIPVVRRKRVAMTGKRGQGARRPHGGPCNYEARKAHGMPCFDKRGSTRLSDALTATPDSWNRLLA